MGNGHGVECESGGVQSEFALPEVEHRCWVSSSESESRGGKRPLGGGMRVQVRAVQSVCMVDVGMVNAFIWI